MTDKYHKHEALHMSNFLVNAITEELGKNPFVQDNPECKLLADKAEESLAELYQLIGNTDLLGRKND